MATGTATAPYNKGRTATHEVGHWLNLYHIWGDDADGNGTCTTSSECAGSDAVSDTPNQCEMKYGAPTGVVTDGCTSTSPGIMYMNYMDYTDDAAMNMFTVGQKARIVATMTGSRSGLQTSTGCSGSTTPTYCSSSGGSTADEWIASVVVGSYTNNSGNNSGYGSFLLPVMTTSQRRCHQLYPHTGLHLDSLPRILENLDRPEQRQRFHRRWRTCL
ncbi:MAG: M43 family zinc metalloprotease [Bacteroidia bacterium]